MSEITPMLDGDPLLPRFSPKLLYQGRKRTARRLAAVLERHGISVRIVDTSNPISEHYSFGTYQIEVYVAHADYERAKELSSAVLAEWHSTNAPRTANLERSCGRLLVSSLCINAGIAGALFILGLRNPSVFSLLAFPGLLVTAAVVGFLLRSSQRTR